MLSTMPAPFVIDQAKGSRSGLLWGQVRVGRAGGGDDPGQGARRGGVPRPRDAQHGRRRHVVAPGHADEPARSTGTAGRRGRTRSTRRRSRGSPGSWTSERPRRASTRRRWRSDDAVARGGNDGGGAHRRRRRPPRSRRSASARATVARVLVDAVGTAHIAFDSGAGYDVLPAAAQGPRLRRAVVPAAGRGAGAVHPRAQPTACWSCSSSARERARICAHLRRTAASPGRRRPRSAPAVPVAAEIAPGGQSVYTLGFGTSVVNFRHSPFAGGETRVLNLLFGDNPPSSADMVAARATAAIVVIFGDGEETRWRVFGGGDVYDINAWATSGTVARRLRRRARDRAARDLPVRPPVAGRAAHRELRGAVRAALAGHAPAAVAPAHARSPPTAASSARRPRSRTRAAGSTWSPTPAARA